MRIYCNKDRLWSKVIVGKFDKGMVAAALVWEEEQYIQCFRESYWKKERCFPSSVLRS